MSVRYEYIDTILADNGVTNPQLNILVADHQLYNTLIYQHKGILSAVTIGNKFIGNADSKEASLKHRAFFELAVQEAAELVMTPEYSCPTEALTWCLASDIFPAEGHLWTIGCESFRPGQLRAFIAQNTTVDTLIISEEPAHQSTVDKVLDPVAYLFRTRPTNDGPLKRIILFQFKTFPMGAVGVEAEHLLFGTRRFVFRNNENSIYLATILCSESMDIDLVRDLRQFVDKPYLLLHPQMNKGARTDALKRYRTDFYNACAEDTEKDLICLNWATGSKVGTEDIAYGNTALYTKAKKIDIEDGRIGNNDRLGLFYNCWSNARASILVFQQEEAIYKFSNSKTSKRPLPVQNQGRYGPEMLNRYVWDRGWQAAELGPDASLLAACAAIGGDFEPIIGRSLSSIDKERLLSLSVGEITNSHWKSPAGSKLFAMANTEESNRLSVYQDPTTQPVKRIWLNRYATLVNHLLTAHDLLPDDCHMVDIAQDVSISYQPPALHYNVTGTSLVPACIVYIGDADPTIVEELKANLLASAKGDNSYPFRLMILYRHQGNLKKNYEPAAPSVTGNNNGNPFALNKKRK